MSEATAAVPGETPKPTFKGVTFNAFAKRERRFVLLRATIGCWLLLVAMYGLFVWLCWPLIAATSSWYGEFFALAANPQPPETAPWRMLPPPAYFQLAGALNLMSVLVYIVIASWEAACLRWLVRGETGGLFLGLGLGADTWRVWLGYWVWFVFLFTAVLILYLPFVFIMLGAVFAGLARGGIDAVSGDDAAAQIFGVAWLVVLAWLALVIWIAVRFAPAAAVSVTLRRFAFHRAWNATRGRFWTLFGAYAWWFALYIVAILVIYAIALFAILAPAFASLATAGGQPDPGAVLAALATPRTWISALVFYATLLMVATTIYVALFGVNARAALVATQEGRI